MASQWWSDDDQLFGALDDALRGARAVPRSFVEAGKAAYTWHDVDAELAALTYDSALDEEHVLAASRAEPAPLRALTFASAELTVEIEVTDDALLGQIVPPQPGELEARLADGQVTTAPVDELGCFVIRPIPSGSFRLHCRTAGGAAVLTDWLTL
jgi:hypothetical protein